jgi:hypothetical protein
MQCSDCSREVKPIVAIDIDGTLGDYHGHFDQFAAFYLNKQPLGLRGQITAYAGVEHHRDWFCRVYKTDLRTFRDIKLAYRQGAQKRSMPVYPAGVQLAQRAVKEEAEVWLTTTRPYLRLDNIDPDTRFWLDIHQVPYYGLVYDEDKYPRLAQSVDWKRVVMVIDDLVEQCEAAGEFFNTPYLVNTWYNRRVTGQRWQLHELEQVMIERIGDWYERTDS